MKTGANLRNFKHLQRHNYFIYKTLQINNLRVFLE